jgi:hypothetical protein
MLAGCSNNEDAPAAPPLDEAAAGAAETPPAAATEPSTSATMEAAHSSMVEGVADVKAMAAEAGQDATTAATEMQTQAAAAGQDAAMKQKAAALVAQYTPQLETLKSGASSIKALIDKNAAMLPEGVSTKYEELSAMIPRLTELVASLRNYQGGDLASITTNLQRDFEKSKALLTELKGMVPTDAL